MAKDPAFLFYPGDWQGGTMYMNHEQKGCYMDLLILQFHVGKFSIAQAKQVLSICFDLAWPMLQQKFKSDGLLYWNERLSEEVERRKNFTKSRRENAKGTKTKKAYAKHMLQHMETENETETIDNYTEWGKKIVQHQDQYWEQMRGRNVTQLEMDEFVSVAVRNAWKMVDQHSFRVTLHGFAGKNNGAKAQNQKNPYKIQ